MPDELAWRAGVPIEKVRLVLDSSRRPLSLDTPVGEDSQLGDFLRDSSAEDPLDSIEEQDLTTQVERTLDTLGEREREILRLRFGIGREDALTLEAVGERFMVTRERIRQIEVAALNKLRRPLRARALQPFVEFS